MTPPQKNKDNHIIRKISLRHLILWSVGGLFLLYIFFSNFISRRLIIEPTLTPIVVPNYVSPDVNLINTPVSITPSRVATGQQNPDVILPSATVIKLPYYVSTDGSDTNPGTSNSPWKTITHAVNNLKAGDSLFIRGGVYQEVVNVTNSGTSINPILISNVVNEEVVIDGNENTLPSQDNGSPLVSILGDWIILRNITVRYSGDIGVYTKGEHVTLDNLFVHHNRGTGVVMTGNYDLIQNSRIWYNSTINENNQSKTGWGSGVSCARYPDYCSILNSIAWENWGEGISTFEALHTNIEGNISYDNQQNFYISDTKYSIMQRNLSYCSTGNAIDSYSTQNGILVGDEKGVPIPLGLGGKRYPSSDNKIINNLVVGCNRNLAAETNQSTNNLYAYNTFVNSEGTTAEKYNIIFFRGVATNGRFENNIIIQEDDRAIAFNAGSGVNFSYNFWSKEPPANFWGVGDIIGDPLLNKQRLPYSPDWFALTKSSPARKKALLIPEVPVDFFGNLRGDSPDMGAIQFVSP